MRPQAGLSLREANPDDLPAIAALRESVGWTVHEWALRAVIGQPHATCLVAEDDGGALVAVGSGIAYRPIGFVGNMVVAETHRRRGLGSALLVAVTDWLAGAGCRRMELNATAEGRPLYERHGFASTGTSVTASIPRGTALAAATGLRVRRVGTDELDAVAAYDTPRFGGDRRPLLALLLADPAAPLLVAERHGRIEGYAGVRTDVPRVGPLLADEPSVASGLLAEAFAMAQRADHLRLNLPPGNRPGAAWLRGLGVEIEPWDGRMARGPQVARREDTIYGMTVGALG